MQLYFLSPFCCLCGRVPPRQPTTTTTIATTSDAGTQAFPGMGTESGGFMVSVAVLDMAADRATDWLAQQGVPVSGTDTQCIGLAASRAVSVSERTMLLPIQ